jgi:predicted nucleic acid-binding protein
MKVILDTGPLVALLNRDDEHHGWAVDALGRLPAPLWTCEPVLAEAAHLTGSPGLIMDMVAKQQLRIGLDIAEEALALGALLRRYGKRMDLVDACVVRMSELAPRCTVVTLDRRDFAVYRRNGRHVIPVVAP